MKLIELVIFFDWVLYIVLCIVAICFIIEQDVIKKFIEKNTDTYETEIEEDVFLSPEFKICDYTYRILKLENQYDIKYANVFDQRAAKNVTTYSLNNGGNPYSGQCFIISPPPGTDLSYDSEHYFWIKFKSTLSIDELPQIYWSASAKNNPTMFKINHDGYPVGTNMNAGELVNLRIKEERIISLPENCRRQPILEYLMDQVSEKKVNCSSKCWPKDWQLGKSFEMSLKLYPRCRDDETNKCMTEWIRSMLKSAKKFCKRVSYTGRVGACLGLECQKVLLKQRFFGISVLVIFVRWESTRSKLSSAHG